MLSEVMESLPDMGQVGQWVRMYAPEVLNWCLIALAASVALRVVLALIGRKSRLMRAIMYLALTGSVLALGGYWLVTGEVPEIVSGLEARLGGFDLGALGQEARARLEQVEVKGLAVLAAGAVTAFLSKPISRMFSRGEGSGDMDIVVKTIGLLLTVLGALMVFDVL